MRISSSFWNHNQKIEETLRKLVEDVAVRSFSLSKSNPYVSRLSRLGSPVEILSYLDEIKEQNKHPEKIQEAVAYSKKILERYKTDSKYAQTDQELSVDQDFKIFLEASQKSKISEKTGHLLEFLVSGQAPSAIEKRYGKHSKAASYAILKPKQTLEKS